MAEFKKPPSALSTLILRVFALLRLTSLSTHPKTGEIVTATNLTILNCLLVNLGPMHEKTLLKAMMSVQASSLLIGLFMYLTDQRRLQGVVSRS